MQITESRHFFSHRGFKLSYLDSAPEDRQRPAVLLMHGFPDTAQMWRAQIDALTAAGYRCIAPDTVGCGASEIAPRRSDYHVAKIVDDHRALLRHLDIDHANVVGHDWGAVQAWMFAGRYPDATRKLVALSVGHPTAYARAGWDQKLAGWYIGYFHLAGLAERLLLGDGRFSLRRMFQHPEMENVVSRMSEPGRLTAALRIYRASLSTVLFKSHPRVTVPTLGIWSENDGYLVESQMRQSEQWVDASWEFERISGGHWIALEHPTWLSQRLLSFLS